MALPLPVLWLCGAPATGKSTVAWQLFTDLGAEGQDVAYVDIDQLGMLYPVSETDPDRASIKATNLAAVIEGHRCAGARSLILSGVLDPGTIPTFVRACDGTGAFTFCHLTVDELTLRDRLKARSWPDDAGDASMAGMRALSMAAGIDAILETSGRTVTEVVSDVRPLLRLLPRAAEVPDCPVPGSNLPMSVVCGPRCVGKSSVSWSMFTDSVSGGTRTGYVDLEQISFLHPIGNATWKVKAHNLFRMVRAFEAQGAKRVIVNGLVDKQTAHLLRQHGNVHIILLTASEDQLRSRIVARVLGDGGARLAGDDLRGAGENRQAVVLATAVEQGHVPDHDSFHDLLVETSQDSTSIAELIAKSTP